VPEDKEVLLIPQNLNIRLRGGVKQLSGVDNLKVKALLNYNNILLDMTGSVMPELVLPEGCTVSSIIPEKIQYIIKKK